jgi:phosphate-selective porin OprO/OprP
MFNKVALVLVVMTIFSHFSMVIADDSQSESALEQRLMALEIEVGELRREAAASKQTPTPDAPGTWQEAIQDCVSCQPVADAANKTYPSVQVTGFFHLDSDWFSQDANNIQTVGANIQDSIGFRRARLAAKGDVTDWISYIIEFDFAVSQPLFVDTWVNLSKIPVLQNVRIGRWRQPFGMSELTSVRNLPFLERPLTFALPPFRQTGIGFFGNSEDERMTWAASAIRFPSDNFGNNAGDSGGYGAVGRITALPIYHCDGEVLLHVGAGYYYADPSLNTSRFASTPEIQIADSLGGLLPTPQLNVPPFVDTGTVPTNSLNAVNAELAGSIGRLTVLSEARWVFVDQIGGPTQTIGGAYATIRYQLTQDRLPYDRKSAVYGAVIPQHSFHPLDGGLGAWELAARWSYLDLNGNWLANAPATPGPGRRLQDVTLGLNWYLNKHAKFQFNYIHAFLDDPTMGSSDADIFAARCQLAF